MMDAVILRNGMVLGGAIGADGFRPNVIVDGAVAWEGERIVAVGPTRDVAAQFPLARVLDAHGGLIMPGLVNLHHHFYSALARGLDPGAPMANFAEVLDRLWWRLDRALDMEAIRVSAELALADCIRAGCTTVFDHHASPEAISGSLETIAGAVEASGLNAVLCYEVTDRNGPAGRNAGIEENVQFIADRADHPRVRGVLGLHASFTVREETLAKVAQRRTPNVGCHIHVAEDPVDGRFSREHFGAGPIERLRAHGLLDARSLLAHGVYLDDTEYATVAEHGAVLIHNPESNANNGVGTLDVARAAGHGCTVGLGTDGMSGSMLRALRCALLMQRGVRQDPTRGFDTVPQLVPNNALAARRFFDEPQLGEITPDAPADLIVVDVPAPTPLDADNAFAHLVYGVSEAPVRHTVVRGRVLLEDFRHRTIDMENLAGRARRVAPKVWQRFHTLRWGTSFLGP